MGILIKDILAVLPVKKEGRYEKSEIKKTSVGIEGRDICFIGDAVPESFKADEVIDGSCRLLIPGLVNAHTHAYMTLFRNAADDLSFMEWLFDRIDPMEQKMTPDDAAIGAKLGMIEMMKSGVTCFADMQMHIHQTTKAVAETGMRAVIGRGLVGAMEAGEVNGIGRKKLEEALEEIEQDASLTDRLSFLLAPHAPYTCDPGYLEYVAKEAKKRGLGIHIHLAESVAECENLKKEYDCTPIEYADRAGCFEVPCIAAHCVQATDSDIGLMAKKGVSVVTNPASNMKLGNGFAPVQKMLDAGINVCLGTDGASSNNTLNLFHEMSLVALIHKGTGMTPQCISAQEVFAMATVCGAKALSLEDKIGTIEVGKRADLAILNLSNPSLVPSNNLMAALSYSANGSEVETVIIDGKITMKDRKILTLDEEEVYRQAQEAAKRIGV